MPPGGPWGGGAEVEQAALSFQAQTQGGDNEAPEGKT